MGTAYRAKAGSRSLLQEQLIEPRQGAGLSYRNGGYREGVSPDGKARERDRKRGQRWLSGLVL